MTEHSAVRYPSEWESDVLAADGGVVHLRPIRPSDADDIGAFLDQLSEETIYYRFFTRRRPPAEEVQRLASVDYAGSFALLAEVNEVIVGIGRYTSEDQKPNHAEVAFVIDDEHQARGLGTLLLEHLAVIAKGNGIRVFHAQTLGDNRRMLRVFSHAGLPVHRELDGGVWEVDLDISAEPDTATLEHFEHTADARSVARILAPSSVAVIGASRRPGTIGNAIMRNLLTAGFAGVVHPVNPNAPSVAGVRSYPTIGDVPDTIDLAIIATPAPTVPRIVDQCAAAGVGALVVISAGFAETGSDGAEAERGLLDTARRSGMRLVGPNGMGVLNTAPDVNLNATFAPFTPEPGGVGFLSQSGALGITILAVARDLGVGLSSFVSVGNKADVSGNDLLQYWEDDPATQVIVLYLESFGNPRKFSRLARRISRDKPIVAVKSGRSTAGRRGARSHTASMASDDMVIDALFDHTGIIRVDTLEQLFDVVRVLIHQPLPQGRRTAIVGNSGGPGILAADACEGAGLEVPALTAATQAALRQQLSPDASVVNPVDMTASAGPRDYELAVTHVLADETVDAVIAIYTDPMVTKGDDVAEAIGRAAATADKPVLATFLTSGLAPSIPIAGRDDRAIPVFPFPESPAVALSRMARLAAWRDRPTGAEPQLTDVDVTAARALVDETLGEHPDGAWLPPKALDGVLHAFGISTMGGAEVGSATEAAAIARALDKPVVLKVVSDSIVHKSDVGGVSLDLRTPDETATAYRTMAERLGDRMQGALVQPMVASGVETIAGVLNDPEFGPLVMFGMGGTAAELFADRAFKIVPLTTTDTAELIRAPKSSAMLFGHRGSAPADITALEDLLIRISALADAIPELSELDLNPVIARPDGISVVDARARVAPADLVPRPFRRMT